MSKKQSVITINFLPLSWGHGRRQREAEGHALWICIHGTNIVNRGLQVLFFSVFCYFSVFFLLPPPPPCKRLNIDIFWSFCYFSIFFSVGPPLEIFLPTPLAGALEYSKPHDQG